MDDPFLRLFSWLAPILQRPALDDLLLDVEERAVLDEFRARWGKMNTETLLKELTSRHGEMAAITMEKVLAKYIREDWAAVGAREAHPGTEIADFIRVLWEPLKKEGFVFSSETVGSTVRLRVSRCPVFSLAQRTGLHQWLYHLACATDHYSTCAFSPRIRFQRTKTLMEGAEYCNHTYMRTGA